MLAIRTKKKILINTLIIQKSKNHFDSTIYSIHLQTKKSKYKTVSTINIGSVVKFLGLGKKGLRRSSKGFSAFLNMVRRNVGRDPINIFYFKGLFYKLLNCKNTLKFFKNKAYTIMIKNNNFFLKTKGKKVKSIRKRLKKKILLLNRKNK